MDKCIEIPGYLYVDIQPIAKGMSSDEKYCMTLSDGRRCLLRISDGNQYQRKTLEFNMMRQAFEHDISTSEPYAFGRYEDGRIFQLTEWLSGKDLESVLPRSSSEECYDLGRRAACLLKKIHSISVPEDAEPWSERFRRKVEIRIKEAESILGMSETLSALYNYMVKNLALLDDCGQCFNHGDFNIGNLILLENGMLAVIDFNGYNGGYGEPIFETTSILFDKNADEHFIEGFSSCYFPKGENRTLLDYYRAYDILARICEGEGNRDVLVKQMEAFIEKIS